ncbi:bifunctional non-homologous end joining protein LigD [Bacillus mesophilus]|uniref:DNA ligase (ATP) n=1 Tax=Bacillus mesophilus TaxID=1808955 RepID=A0A6M0Q442_9BACI|nr:DNA ligase D [Bacillus mesophilus]MBM7659672.1 bifunctional non-homologous end joining protein LigD [Bacillus mesophilus]NEY70539.1 DNA ligase D [Bacillus mesophilus]
MNKIPKPMLPTLTTEFPKGNEWAYEIKYDGFRAMFYIDEHNFHLISRNGLSLTEQFPEAEEAAVFARDIWKNELPILFDGELCILESSHKANFEDIQLRGRLKTKDKIIAQMNRKKAHYCVFDLLILKNKQISQLPYQERKNELRRLFEDGELPTEVQPHSSVFFQYIKEYTDKEEVWKLAERFDAEGVIVKLVTSKWEEGKRTTQWYKIKNWKEGSFFVLAYEKKNGFFHLGILRNQEVFSAGLVSHGFSSEERDALIQVIKANKKSENQDIIFVEPSICMDILFLELYKDQVRQPSFKQFRFDLKWEDCTWEKLQQSIHPIPEEITITHPDKPLWPKKNIDKQTYIIYLRSIAPYLLPFLENRLLTVIRYPHGMLGDPFYQKNCPDYAPEFIQTSRSEGINYIVCNNIETLMWLGNQLAFEFHIPFQTIHSNGPSEIVFDLDPPSRDYFFLAVKAALMMKEVFDGLKLQTFVKTSGNKGLQIYVPLPENTFSYDETRKFTEFIAHYLITKDPDHFTIERLKKNRGTKLYVDYIQHAEGKTIISPYSARGNEDGLVATPLYWDEVTEELTPELFPVDKMVDRIKQVGDPFQDFFKAKDTQPFQDILEFLTRAP